MCIRDRAIPTEEIITREDAEDMVESIWDAVGIVLIMKGEPLTNDELQQIEKYKAKQARAMYRIAKRHPEWFREGWVMDLWDGIQLATPFLILFGNRAKAKGKEEKAEDNKEKA